MEMKLQSAIYFPLLRGRAGELEALQALWPTARARLTPVIELPTPRSEASAEQHVGAFACRVSETWGVASPVYLDLKRRERGGTSGVTRFSRTPICRPTTAR